MGLPAVLSTCDLSRVPESASVMKFYEFPCHPVAKVVVTIGPKSLFQRRRQMAALDMKIVLRIANVLKQSSKV